MRKTVDVSELRDKANEFLAYSDPEMVGMREGVAALLEYTLHSTGNYNGFSYLPTEWDGDLQRLRDGYDDSRRKYL